MIDAPTVTALLAAHLDPTLRCERVSRAAVGNGQETWLVDAVDGAGSAVPLVLRRSAPAGVLDDTDRAHEFATLRALSGRGLPIPAVHWLEMSPGALQRPYFVMDRMPGRPAAPRSADDAAAIAHDLGRRLAQLHALRVDVPGAVPGADPAHPEPADVRAATLREVARWRRRYRDRRVAPVPMIGALLAWLEVNAPESGPTPCLLWGDAGPHNVLVTDNEISAMLDWELSHYGDPMEDLGAAVWACLGRYPQDEVIAGYAAASGGPVDLDVVAYFAVLGCVSRSIMQLAGIGSFVRGETNALNLAGLGLTLPIANLRRAAAYAGWPDSEITVEPEGFDGSEDADPLRLRPDVAETLSGIARFLRDELLPTVEAAHLQRGVKTAVGLLQASARRSRQDDDRAGALATELDGLFDRLAAAGCDVGARDAAALESVAAQIESDPTLVDRRTDVRRVLLHDLIARSSSLEPLVAMYGRDVQAGPGFTH